MRRDYTFLQVYSPNDIIHFGKHKGKRLKEIVDIDPYYVHLMIETIPGFFIKPEDVTNLVLSNTVFRMSEPVEHIYLEKNSAFEKQFVLKQPSLPEVEWKGLKTTRRNAQLLRFIKDELLSFEYSDVFALLSEAIFRESWRYCQLAVDSFGCPMVRVYADLSPSLLKRTDSSAAFIANEGLFGVKFPKRIKVDANMDTPGFGAVVYRLVEHGLLKISAR
jgi:hypothetical protein